MPKARNLLKAGITGGIGSGKSLVCEIFSILRVPVYNADQRAKFLMENDPLIIEQVRQNFSDESYAEGRLNRNFLAGKVFNDKIKLGLLNQIVHPRVKIDFEEWVRNIRDCKYIIKEAALLFESNSYQDLDRTILIVSPVEIRIKRIIMRDRHRNRKDIENIIEKQMPDNEKKKLADYVIQNDDTCLIIPQVLKIHQELLSI